MERSELLCWLREADPGRLEALWRRADRIRADSVGDEVHLRGLIEVSNHCVRQCSYCGLRDGNRALSRYRMAREEVTACAQTAVDRGYGTVVLQAGEDPGLTSNWVSDLVQRLKGETPLAVTLSLGERTRRELEAWRAAGADRYLLKFETSNRALYDRWHPPLPGRASDRVALLKDLRAMGYETGSGAMVGLPGQTYADLANDILLFAELDLDMIGVGPFIPHPATPLGAAALTDTPDQVPATELLAYKTVALTRLLCPAVNIPSTTALATVSGDATRQIGLQRGANVIMPNLTPLRYRVNYEIYPSKGRTQAAETSDAAIRQGILAAGRRIGVGPGAAARMAR